jgi:superfamily II DNA/RNA helicase
MKTLELTGTGYFSLRAVLLPLRALVNDKYEDLRRKYASLGLRVIRSTGEIADDNNMLMRGKFDIALLTYERFTTLAVVAPFILRNVGLVVVDEVQMIADEGRGANLEFLLTYLRSQRIPCRGARRSRVPIVHVSDRQLPHRPRRCHRQDSDAVFRPWFYRIRSG